MVVPCYLAADNNTSGARAVFLFFFAAVYLRRRCLYTVAGCAIVEIDFRRGGNRRERIEAEEPREQPEEEA